MSDLRTGLVEAMRRALGEEGEWWGPNGAAFYAETALDAALGFLTDNAEAWEEAAAWFVDDEPPEPWVNFLIAALSDSRDTGEKP